MSLAEVAIQAMPGDAAPELLQERLGPPPAPTIEIGRSAKGIIGQTVSGATIVGDLH